MTLKIGGILASWLTDVFAEQSIVWLLITSIVAAIFGFISSYMTYHYIKRREIADTVIVESEKERKERIRQEVTRWANPILGAVQDLEAKLRNILEMQGYEALTEDYQEKVNPDWSISYDYFMHSALYLFAQYFCWIRMLQENLNFELFQTQQEKGEFFNAMDDVSKALGDFPPNYGRGDKQVFKLQQRAIGEQMIIHNGSDRRCMSLPEFIKKLSEDKNFENHIKPLRSLLEDLNPDDIGRWERLITTQKQLKKLNEACTKLLSYKL